MKRVCLSLFVAVLCAGWASGADVTKQINRIKQAYATAQNTIAMADEEPMTRNTFTINIDQMYPGSGPHKEVVQFFFTCLDFGEEDTAKDGSINWKSTLYFVRHNYNVGASQFYNEYLYDSETSDPLFALYTYPDEKTGEKQSFRVYFDKGKVIQTNPGTLPEGMNANKFLSDFKRMQNIFKMVILDSPLI